MIQSTIVDAEQRIKRMLCDQRFNVRQFHRAVHLECCATRRLLLEINRSIALGNRKGWDAEAREATR
ncbi:hypothetical protein GCM10007901_05580 [Dyella acidisoli]|uniref:Uncharacterized protein n=1 Tax=Dyella acidisoli TaxID=1867834 RepID=A0ABQ5XIX1_9GAMM|nr:hypothetical protein GCM10007901_05580 [Dyella acidisoli]